MKFQIIMTYKNRKRHLETCLHYLNLASGKHDVDVILCCAEDVDIDFAEYENIQVEKLLIPQEGLFNKAILLNKGIERGNILDFQYRIFLDCDLIVKSVFFSEVIMLAKKGVVFLGGMKLTPVATNKIFINASYPSDEQIFTKGEYGEYTDQSFRENKKWAYIGNYCISKAMILLWEEIIGQYKYNESFLGFGGEDSVFSMFASDLQSVGLGVKMYHPDAWRHLDHKRACEQPDFDKAQYEKNVALMYHCIQENRGNIQEFIKSKRPQDIMREI